MGKYLVTYDLNKTGQNYDGLNAAIKTYPWAKIATTTYAIKSTQSATEIRNALQKHIDANDRIFVANIANDWGAYNLPKEVTDWLNAA